jgi:hypothetical protein
MEDNSHAGQGAVLLDIGGDIGALVVTMPESMEGVEVEIRPVGAGAGADGSRPVSDHQHPVPDPDHHHGHEHDHPHDHAHPWPHVAVVARPAPAGIVYSLVYPQLREGTYELYERPHGPVELTVEVTGGYVAEAVWPR